VLVIEKIGALFYFNVICLSCEVISLRDGRCSTERERGAGVHKEGQAEDTTHLQRASQLIAALLSLHENKNSAPIIVVLKMVAQSGIFLVVSNHLHDLLNHHVGSQIKRTNGYLVCVLLEVPGEGHHLFKRSYRRGELLV
jgi:hypothetical protein